ncbi:MAG: hypothetical protein ACSHX9_12875 [Luteolibacter sp.]
MSLSFRLFFLLIVGLTSVHGQGELETEKKTSRLFSCFVWEDLGVGKVFYAEGAEPKELEFTNKRRSEYYPIPVSKIFRLFTEIEVEGKMSHKVIGETEIKSGSKRLLMIVERNTKFNEKEPGSFPLKITVLDDSINNFPGGSTKFINLTSKPLTAEINGTKAVVNSNRSKLVRPSIPENGAFLPLFVRFEKTSLYETRIYCQEGERRIIFMRPSAKKDSRRPIAIDFLPQIVGPSFNEK